MFSKCHLKIRLDIRQNQMNWLNVSKSDVVFIIFGYYYIMHNISRQHVWIHMLKLFSYHFLTFFSKLYFVFIKTIFNLVLCVYQNLLVFLLQEEWKRETKITQPSPTIIICKLSKCFIYPSISSSLCSSEKRWWKTCSRPNTQWFCEYLFGWLILLPMGYIYNR